MVQKLILTPSGQTAANFDEFPDTCPVCLVAASPIDVNVGFGSDSGGQLVFRCPRLACRAFFIAYYKFVPQTGYYLLDGVKPKTHRASVKSEAITALSPSFVKIVNQSEIAETQELDEIAGVGYRRALEFLIKDYLISLTSNEEQKELIRKTFLGKCISEFVKNENIKLVAKRAAWLGNDETHYVRKWENKDIKDLKVMISMTVAWIEIELFTVQLEKDMPEPLAPAKADLSG